MVQTIAISDLLNQPDATIDFLVDRFEHMVEPRNIRFPHKHTFYEILWITKGRSQQNIDFKDYSIAENTLFFISPGQLHLFENWESIEGFAILFTEDFFLRIFQNKHILFELSYLDNLHDNPFLPLKPEDAALIQPLIDLLLTEHQRAESDPESLSAILFVLLKKIQQLFATQHHHKNDKHQMVVFKQFKYALESHFTQNLTAHQYADLLHISAHQLNTLVKKVSGKTTSDLIKERMIVEAKQLLQFTDKTVSQIADQLGFEDSSYFARYFKKQVGMAPVDFRKKHS